MSKVRLFPPTDIQKQTLTVNGRDYHATPGGFVDIDAASNDVGDLGVNGWTFVAPVGATGQRPANPNRGDTFLDTDLAALIVFDGKDWRSPATAAIV